MLACLCQLEHSHPDNVLYVKILQWCDVGVVTFVILQDHLLDDAVQQQPVLHCVPTSLVWRERKREKAAVVITSKILINISINISDIGSKVAVDITEINYGSTHFLKLH